MSPAESAPQAKCSGPRTPEGRAISSHNALRHGLTGRVVVLPTEDMNVYRAFCNELMADLAPETPLERQYAQTFCDTQWRLNRARSYEDGMLALGHFEHAGSLAADDPQILAALTAAKAFRDNSKAFVNMQFSVWNRLKSLKNKGTRHRENPCQSRFRLGFLLFLLRGLSGVPAGA